MQNTDNRMFEIQNEIQKLKLELHETFGNYSNLVTNLELKVDNVMKENQITLKFNNEVNDKIKNDIKSTLKIARAMVHDLSQPLTVLIGRCELLGMLAKQNPEIKNHIDSMLSSAAKINTIIRKIQTLNHQMSKQYDELYIKDRIKEG